MRMRSFSGLIAGAFLALSGGAFAHQLGTQSVPVVATGPGGNLVEYARQVSVLRSEGAPVQFIGRCGSACTLYLTLPTSQVCLWPGARFEFHAAYGASRDFNRWGSEYMMDRYPQWVQTWIRSRGGLTNELLSMSYAYASQFVPACDPTVATEQVARL